MTKFCEWNAALHCLEVEPSQPGKSIEIEARFDPPSHAMHVEIEHEHNQLPETHLVSCDPAAHVWRVLSAATPPTGHYLVKPMWSIDPCGNGAGGITEFLNGEELSYNDEGRRWRAEWRFRIPPQGGGGEINIIVIIVDEAGGEGTAISKAKDAILDLISGVRFRLRRSIRRPRKIVPLPRPPVTPDPPISKWDA